MHYVKETNEIFKSSGLPIDSVLVVFEEAETYPANYDVLFLRDHTRTHKNLQEKITKSRKLRVWVQSENPHDSELFFHFLREESIHSKQSFQRVHVDMGAFFTYELLSNNGFFEEDVEHEVSRSNFTLEIEKVNK